MIMRRRNQDDENQPDSLESTPKDTSQCDDVNTIKRCLRCNLESDLFRKFQLVLDYIGPKVYVPIYDECNKLLLKSMEMKPHLNGYFQFDTYLMVQAKFYAFYFVKQIGNLLTHQKDKTDLAEKNCIYLTKILLYHGLVAKNDTANLALVELEQLSLNCGLPLQSLYYKYRAKYLRVIIKALLQKLKHSTTSDSELLTGDTSSTSTTSLTNGKSRHSVITYFIRALDVLNVGTLDSKDIAQSLIITTNLLHKESFDDVIKRFLEDLAASQDMSISTLIRAHIQTIVVSLILKQKLSHIDMEASLNKLCNFCHKKLSAVLANKITPIKGQLMLYYFVNRRAVVDGIFFLSKFDRVHDQPMEEELDDEEHFVDYLSRSLIGILLSIDEHFLATKREFGSEESILKVKGLTKFLSMLRAKHVDEIQVKLLSTLASLVNIRPSLTNTRLDKAILESWDLFVGKLSADKRSNLAVNICVNLQDMVENFPDEVGSIYEKLLLGYNTIPPSLKIAMRSLFFIPNIPQFEKIYNLITTETNRSNLVSDLNQLQDNIEYAKPLLLAENQKSKILGLMKLRDLLSTNQNLIRSSIITHLEEPVDPIISKITQNLLELSCNMDIRGTHLLAECFGILGAINPVRIDTQIHGCEELKMDCIVSLEDTNLIINLVEILKSCLFSDQANESEMATYALQIVIENFPIHKNPDVKGRLSAEGLRAYELCRNTKYKGFRRYEPEVTTSIYEKLISEKNYSYKDWIDKFSLSLFPCISSKKVQDVLHACSYVFRYNVQLAEFLLPYVIVHIVIERPIHISLVKRELLAIVQKDVGLSTQQLDELNDMANGGDNIRTLLVQCSNIIFRTLDLVNRINWKTRGDNPKIKLAPYQIEHLTQFAESIPQDKLAMMAAKCRFNLRALYYLDQHLTKTKQDLNNYATSLQKIYVSLDDNFEAAGIEMVRTSPMTICDEISHYEAMGQFDKAFSCCMTVLSSEKNGDVKERLISDSLRCLSNQGDFQRLYDRTKQVMDEHIELRRNVMPYAIEATWKLSKWDKLDNYLTIETSQKIAESPAVGFGQLLSCLNNSRSKVASTIQYVRQDLMRPLSLAMVDKSAYFRGYENLLSLHCIGDFSICLKVLDDINIDSQQVDDHKVDFTRIRLDKSLNQLFAVWNERNTIIQPSLKSIEYILQWQRAICSLVATKYQSFRDKINIYIGKSWLESAKVAREARSFNRSFDCLIQARHSFGPEFDKLSLDLRVKYHIEQAELYWDQGDYTKAIRLLKHTMDEFKDHELYKHLETRKIPKDTMTELSVIGNCQSCSDIAMTDRESFGKLNMLLIQYNEESASATPITMFGMYERCVHLGVDREETYFRLARYYDKLFTYYLDNPNLCSQQNNEIHDQASQVLSQNLRAGQESYLNLMEHSVKAFGNSLKYGARHLRESMPRMLNIWYDLGNCKSDTPDQDKRKSITGSGSGGSTGSGSGKELRQSPFLKNTIARTTQFIAELKDKHIPPYYFMTAISIILSSISRLHPLITNRMVDIIDLLLCHYTHQLAWLMLPLYNDTNTKRKDQAKYHMFRTRKHPYENVAQVCKDTFDFSIILSIISYDPKRENNQRPPAGIVNIKTLLDMKKLAARFKYSNHNILAPIQATINPVIPMDVAKDKEPEKHKIFPEHNMHYVIGFSDEVRIFNSLQKPKMVTLKCHNGKEVNILCKYGDDLRKDSRCNEFLNFLNIILKRDSQSNLRFMDIQTFLVIPLTENIGLIEMVPDCLTLRFILDGLYRERKKNWKSTDGVIRQDKIQHSAQHMLEHFVKEALGKNKPAVLPTWFLRTFTDPTSWYMARLSYTRSLAVTSMGGYIIGLGDRHLDNVLINRKTAKIVHVDFNLLFHQAETLNVPELVPFRLTQNLVAALGPMGTEGNFRKVCESTMRAMRKEKDAMLTTLKPFIHDPCNDWRKSAQSNTENPAKSRIEVTERKLKGFPRSRDFKPITMINSYPVEAQVDNLITEATDNQNLSMMYYGWCAHL